jgi:hypothetical protein
VFIFPKSFDIEVVGTALDVIAVASIAIQLAETINEIVTFGKAFQDAPTRLRAFLHDLEVLAAVASHIQHLSGHVAIDNCQRKGLKQLRIQNLEAVQYHRSSATTTQVKESGREEVGCIQNLLAGRNIIDSKIH